MKEVMCELVFPTTIFIVELDDAGYREELVDFSHRKQQSSDGVQKTNMNGGWQSDDSFLEQPICAPLRKELEGSFATIRDSLKIAEGLKIFNSWINVNGRGAYNARHIHSRSFFSGVYYLRTPENCGDIIFHSPLIAKEMIDAKYTESSAITSNKLVYPAVAGRTYIFPSWIGHSVEPNNSDELRISISFNAFFDRF